MELQMHRVPLLGLLKRSVVGVARSGSVIVVGEEALGGQALRSSSAPNRGGDERRWASEGGARVIRDP